jgi:hypothetical protein
MAVFVCVLAFGVWLVWVGVTWRYGRFKDPGYDFQGVLPLVSGVYFAGFGLLGLFMFLRTPVILAGDTLRVWKGLSRHVTIPVQEITGVGLVFKPNPRGREPSGWRLVIWSTDAHFDYLGIGYFSAAFRRRESRDAKTRVSEKISDPVANTDVRQLASTYAAQVARAIYDNVTARQGPSGQLAIQQMQKHVQAGGSSGIPKAVAWWSPDGIMGLASGAKDLKD